MIHKQLFILFLFIGVSLQAQLSLNVESNSQYYIDDDKIQLMGQDTLDRFRSNNYVRAAYQWDKFTFGAQLESYAPSALLNYAPSLDGTGIGTFYIRYKDEKSGFSATAGHLYEQFGNGLILRTWEDRQIGIFNSLVGGRVKYENPDNYFSAKAFYGHQRIGFDITDSRMMGADTELRISELLNSSKVDSKVGFGFVNRYEDAPDNSVFNPNVSLYSSRLDLGWKNFTLNFEYNYKTKDAIKENSAVDSANVFPGNAYQLDLGYSKKGLGIVLNLRRIENFSDYSERQYIPTTYNETVLNYVPALTRQFDYSLYNIYVYQSQPFLTFSPQKKAGEMGSQLDVYYKIPRDTKLGGKYGTELSMNLANWYGLKGKYRDFNTYNYYETEFLTLGERYYSNLNLEMKKKFNKNWVSILSYLYQYYNTARIEETVGEVNTHTIVADNAIKFKNKQSIRFELQHQWADSYRKNWAAGLIEYNFLKNWTVFINDLYNYGNDHEDERIHYYNAGLIFRKNNTRIQANYGRQRGGLLCVGGVCRFVPESNGFSLGISSSL